MVFGLGQPGARGMVNLLEIGANAVAFLFLGLFLEQFAITDDLIHRSSKLMVDLCFIR